MSLREVRKSTEAILSKLDNSRLCTTIIMHLFDESRALLREKTGVRKQ
jgi:hypothetical protein